MLNTLPLPRAVAVFCGSRSGAQPAHAEATRALGAALAASGVRLVYGGGRMGLMGVLADSVLAGGGQVCGVIPRFLKAWEVAHPGVADMIEVESMHARKALMLDLADAVIVMPGGLGTLDEAIEAITWRSLGLHNKPIFVCDVAGSARGLVAAIDAAVADDFAKPAARELISVAGSVPVLMAALAARFAPAA